MKCSLTKHLTFTSLFLLRMRQSMCWNPKLDNDAMFLTVSTLPGGVGTWKLPTWRRKVRFKKAQGEETAVMISNHYLPQSTITVGSIIESKTSHQVAGHKWFINRQRDRWWYFQAWRLLGSSEPPGLSALAASILVGAPPSTAWREQVPRVILWSSPVANTPVHTVPALAPQGCRVHVYFCKRCPLCAGCLGSWWRTCDPGTQGARCGAQGVWGTLGGFLEGTRTMHPRTLAFRVGFSLPCVANCWVTAPILHMQPSDHVAPLYWHIWYAKVQFN